ncbi:hypothetical protein B0H13DRAFT_2305902 [Mycena leptocephala]|nr:hypothetical protein B0H13DRAFT_2305902 [Mycena leptocephala]
MPYLPFPPTWSVYTTALKLGNWLEHYAEAMELDVWTFSTVHSARPNDGGTCGTLLPGDVFRGQSLHSTLADHAGQKVLVVGACTSAHNIVMDYYENGAAPKMAGRESCGQSTERAGPTELADRLTASSMSVPRNQRLAKIIAADDKDVLNGLRKRGFRLNMGTMDAGFALSAWDLYFALLPTLAY